MWGLAADGESGRVNGIDPTICALPDTPCSVLIEDFLVAHDEQRLHLSLGYQHSVERILQRPGQLPSTNSVIQRNGQTQKTFPREIASEVVYQLRSARDPSQ